MIKSRLRSLPDRGRRPTLESNMKSPGQNGTLGRRIAGALSGLTLEKVAEEGYANAQVNREVARSGKSILDLRDTALMDGDDALIIATGPSLHRQNYARDILESGYKGVIIATESALRYCFRNGIVPDLTITLDAHPKRVVRWFGDPSLNAAALKADDYFARQDMDPEFNRNQLRHNTEVVSMMNDHGRGMKIAISSGASAAVVSRVADVGMDAYWWNPYYDDYDLENSLTRRVHELNGLPCLNAGGNVGTACWALAATVLGKTRIGLAGMDLSYYPDTPHENTQYYYEILDLVGPERLDEVYVQIHNPHLDKAFYTDPAYLWYRDVFLDSITQTRVNTINCTGGGILFGRGIEWMTLKNFLSGSGD